MTEPLITKQAAAQRQIDAAIRMLLLHCEDFVAIHNVATAARGILKDLAEARGVGLTQITRETLEEIYRTQQGLSQLTSEIAAKIEQDARNIENDARTWKFRNKAANFLKHGDRDSDVALDLGELDTLWTIAETIWLWCNLKLPLTDEMLLYSLWFGGVTASKRQDFINTKAGPLHLLPWARQVDVGRYGLRLIYRRKRQSTRRFRDDAAYQTNRLLPNRSYCSLPPIR